MRDKIAETTALSSAVSNADVTIIQHGKTIDSLQKQLSQSERQINQLNCNILTMSNSSTDALEQALGVRLDTVIAEKAKLIVDYKDLQNRFGALERSYQTMKSNLHQMLGASQPL